MERHIGSCALVIDKERVRENWTSIKKTVGSPLAEAPRLSDRTKLARSVQKYNGIY